MPLTRAEQTLLRNRLVRFGVAAERAEQIVSEGRVRHQHGPRKGDAVFLDLRLFRNPVHLSAWLSGLALAEHIARVCANWDRCYTVDTTRLAMAARS